MGSVLLGAAVEGVMQLDNRAAEIVLGSTAMALLDGRGVNRALGVISPSPDVLLGFDEINFGEAHVFAAFDGRGRDTYRPLDGNAAIRGIGSVA